MAEDEVDKKNIDSTWHHIVHPLSGIDIEKNLE